MSKLDFTAKDLAEEQRKEMEKHQNFSQTNMAAHYDELCCNYDDIYLKVGFPDPKKCADFVNELNVSTNIADATIFDMGCGTGLVGKYLVELGFVNIHGVDASGGMLKEATGKNAYTLLEELFLGSPSTFPSKFHSSYDFITASGILADNHLDNSVFEEMLLALKVGGIAIFTTRTEYLTLYGYGPYLKKLVDEGKWKMVKNEAHFKYDKIEEAVGRFAKTEVQVFAYQKL